VVRPSPGGAGGEPAGFHHRARLVDAPGGAPAGGCRHRRAAGGPGGAGPGHPPGQCHQGRQLRGGGGLTPLALLAKLTRGDVSQAELAIIEGWNFRQLRAALDRHPDLRHDSAGLSDAELLARIGSTASHPEGLFFPDTYLFSRRSSDLDVLRRAHRHMLEVLDGSGQRAGGLPYKTPYQALTMASIVEKETGQAADRPMVASVFVNRCAAACCCRPTRP
jgi:hypothetical protein